MPLAMVKLPTGSPKPEVQLAYLCECGDGDFTKCGHLTYLQTIRSGVLRRMFGDAEASHYAVGYRHRLDEYVKRLQAEIAALQFDAIVAPPSSSNHPTPYLEGLLQSRPNLLNLSPFLSRPNGVGSGSGDMTVTDYASQLTLEGHGDLSVLTSLLIVDDIFGKGTTAAALLLKLEQAGLSKNCAAVVAVPLKLRQKPESCLT